MKFFDSFDQFMRIAVVVLLPFLFFSSLGIAFEENAESWYINPVRRRLLSDNEHYRGPQIETGVTYNWETEPTNPPDRMRSQEGTFGRRLLDGDRPSNWHTTTGWNHRDNAVVFDFKKNYRFVKVRLHFHKALPRYVEIQRESETRDGEGAEWSTLARLDDIEDGWNGKILADAPVARHLRVFVKLDEWGVYFREAQFYGLPADETKPVAPPVKREDGRLMLASGGDPHVSVVVDRTGGDEAVHSARKLRDTLSSITGAEIPLFDAEEDPDGARLVVGPGALAEELGVSTSQEYLPGKEGYVIRSVGDDIVLLGNDAGEYRGTAMAVVDFLQRLGYGCFAPDPLYHVVPDFDTLSLPPFDIYEQPHFIMRHLTAGGAPEGLHHPLLRDAWRIGGYRLSGGHVLGRRLVASSEFEEENPYWFGPGQVCLTHPGVRDQLVKELRQRLNESSYEFVSLGIGARDNAEFCQCEDCRAVGNISARYMKFANSIAKKLRETHEGRFNLNFLAYWRMHSPPNPMVVGEPEVIVRIVNEGDSTKPVYAPVPPEHRVRGRNNFREQRAISGWLKTGSLQGVYDWWIPGCSNEDWRHMPWYSGETAMKNLRFWKERGLNYLSYETGYEHGDGFPLRWPLYYIGARGSWDSSLSADEIMKEACSKLFGEQREEISWDEENKTLDAFEFLNTPAEHMFWFYRTLEMAMLHTPHPCGNWHLPSPELVYTPDIESRATDHIESALEMADRAEVKERISSELRMWNEARATISELRAEEEDGEVFEVHVEDEVLNWSEPEIGESALRDIAGFDAEAVIEVVEVDGQTREVQPGEEFDLRTGIRFRLTGN